MKSRSGGGNSKCKGQRLDQNKASVTGEQRSRGHVVGGEAGSGFLGLCTPVSGEWVLV